MDRRQFMKAAGVGAAGGAVALVPLGASATAQEGPEQLSCPIEDHYTTSAETQEGVAARLLEHMIEEHPRDDLDPTVVPIVKSVTSKFR